jgi:beta-glucosidase/6-phospho-beta-glucosidase/beta-galactosidase
MFIMQNFEIPEQYLDEIKSLDISLLKFFLSHLVDYLTKDEDEDDIIGIDHFDGPVGTSKELYDWINSLSSNEYIDLVHYVLSLLKDIMVHQ